MLPQRPSQVVQKLVRFLVPDTKLERRRRPRLRTDVEVILSGNCGQTTARGVDMNRSGMGVLTNQPIDVDTLLFVQLPDCGMMGFAHVRRCDAQPEGFNLLGLEFREPLTRERSAGLRPDSPAWQIRVARGTSEWNVADDAY
jgi:hypothetical protein